MHETMTSKVATGLRIAMLTTLAVAVLRIAGLEPPHVHALWAWAYNIAEGLAGLVCLHAAWSARRGSAERRAWSLLALGILVFTVADVYFVARIRIDPTPPFPSLADAGYLMLYPCAGGALLLLVRARAGAITPGLWLDGAISAASAAALGATLAVDVLHSTHGPLATVLTNVAYPVGDLTLLAVVFAAVTITGLRAGRAWLLLAGAALVLAVGDTRFLVESAAGTYAVGSTVDLTWPGAFALFALATGLPAVRVDPTRLRDPRTLRLPAVMAVAALAILTVDHYSRANPVGVWLAAAALLLTIARFGLAIRENARLLQLRDAEASTDALTGLRNRRALLRDLEHALADPGPGEPLILALYDLDGFKAYNDAFGHPAGDALLVRLGANLRTTLREHGATAYRLGGDEFCVMGPAGEEPTRLVELAAGALREHGRLFDVGCSHGHVLLPLDAADAAEALRVADARMYAHKGTGRRSAAQSVHEVLLQVLREHDGELVGHVEDVGASAVRVGRRLGLDDAALADLRRAADLHDVGKVAIPDAILQAPRPLDETEWAYMREHASIGARILHAAPGLAGVADTVASHHERFDGTGYPAGLAGGDIPLGARIIAVCDAFHAMTADRPYRPAMARADALRELADCAGTHFDPVVVEAFLALTGEEARLGVLGLGPGAAAGPRTPAPAPARAAR
jgi:diguanylate cyclase (GGDEF)-like protein